MYLLRIEKKIVGNFFAICTSVKNIGSYFNTRKTAGIVKETTAININEH